MVHMHVMATCALRLFKCAMVMQESEVLIKAFKEHERRNGTKEGFAHTPADALAFKYYRDVSAAYKPC